MEVDISIIKNLKIVKDVKIKSETPEELVIYVQFNGVSEIRIFEITFSGTAEQCKYKTKEVCLFTNPFVSIPFYSTSNTSDFCSVVKQIFDPIEKLIDKHTK